MIKVDGRGAGIRDEDGIRESSIGKRWDERGEGEPREVRWGPAKFNYMPLAHLVFS